MLTSSTFTSLHMFCNKTFIGLFYHSIKRMQKQDNCLDNRHIKGGSISSEYLLLNKFSSVRVCLSVTFFLNHRLIFKNHFLFCLPSREGGQLYAARTFSLVKERKNRTIASILNHQTIMTLN